MQTLGTQSGGLTIRYEKIHEESSSQGGRYQRFAAVTEGAQTSAVSVRSWAEFLTSTREAATQLSDVIKLAPYNAVFFETKGTTWNKSLTEQFEFVLVDAPFLENFVSNAGPNKDAFSEHFAACRRDQEQKSNHSDNTACVFSNLSGDAVLISPLPLPEQNASLYGHLMSFVRGGPKSQIEDVWQTSAQAYLERLQERGDEPVWLSTSGAGISWLHVRLDDRPKYYNFSEFRQA